MKLFKAFLICILFLEFSSASAQLDSVKVTIPEINLAENEQFAMNIVVDDLTDLSITSLQFTLFYSDTVLRAQGVSAIGTLLEPWGQPVASISDSGSITVGIFGINPLAGEGNLINILFEATGSVGDSSLIYIKPFTFNEGDPKAIVDSGYVTIQDKVTAVLSSNYPSKTTLLVDGLLENTPVVTDWTQYSDHVIGANSPQMIAEHERYNFSHWSDGGSSNHSITTMGDSLFTAFYDIQYELSIQTDGILSSLLNWDDEWHKKDTTATVGPAPPTIAQGSAVGDTVFQFSHWDLDGVRIDETSFDVVMDVPHSLTVFYLVESIVNVDFVGQHIKSFVLHQNYPNPFNPTTTVQYQVPYPSHVELDVYNLNGQKIKSLVNEEMNEGYHNVIWDATNDSGLPVSSGVYVLQMRSDTFNKNIKISLLR
jgi:hypothetical protein